MKQHNQSYLLYYSLIAAGVVCFTITSLMGYLAAVAQSASGGLVLGAAFIAIHIIGVAIMGSVSGSFARRKRWIGAIATGFIVVGAALLSVKNVTDYVATERTSLMKARQAQAAAQDERTKASLEATKKRQDLQAKLAESQMKWIQGTRGRNQADMAEQGNNLIKDIGKADVSMPDLPKQEVIMRTESGNELISKIFGWDRDAIELTQMLYGSIFLIILESFLWPLAAFFKPGAAEAAALAIAASAPLTPIVESPKAKLLAAPKKDKPITVRMDPTPEWRQLLDEIDYPPAGSRHKGPPRSKDRREHVAPRFLVFMQAYSETGEITTDELTSIYEDFNGVDHRVAWGDRIVKSELEGLGRKFVTKNMGKSPTVYSIPIQTPDKVRSLLEKRGVLTANRAVSTPEPEPEDEPDTTESAEGSESKLLSFSMFRTKHAGGQVH